jgi:hypothetical protein
MEDMTFNTPQNQTIGRELLILCLNTGTESAPVWSPVGKRVADSTMAYDWKKETSTDVLGNNYTQLSKPQITQTFDPWQLDSADEAQKMIWDKGIRDQDADALAAFDMLVIHKYAGTADTKMFSERYSACAVTPTSLGGTGGGKLAMPIEVTYGGERTIGTASIAAGSFTFTPDGTAT